MMNSLSPPLVLKTGLLAAISKPGTWFFRALPPEMAHDLSIWTLAQLQKLPRAVTGQTVFSPRFHKIFNQQIFGKNFIHPIGMAAGYDKDARAFDALLRMGFAFVETGSVTPLPQAGNPSPRLFRLVKDQAVLNRMGFNSRGQDDMIARLDAWQASKSMDAARDNIARLGINLGKNKQAEAIDDYQKGAYALSPYADYMVVNLSSPNTPGLRDLQKLDSMMDVLKAARAGLEQAKQDGKIKGTAPPLLVKLAPDMEDSQLKSLAKTLADKQNLVEGVILTNTTLARPASLQSPLPADSSGGLSGAPLAPYALDTLKKFYLYSDGRLPLIGCGGIGSGLDIYQRLKSGASLIEIYSVLIYKSPRIIFQMLNELADCLDKDGFSHINQAIGVDAK